MVRRWDWPKDFRRKGLITTTPQPIPEIWQFKRDLLTGQDKDGHWPRPRNAHITVGNTLDNSSNLDQGFLESIVAQYGNTRLGQQEIAGEILEDVPGALWKASMIDPHRVELKAVPDQYTAVVALDPSASDAKKQNPDSREPNEAGIVVVAAGPAPGGWDPNFRKLDELHNDESLGALLRRMNSMHAYILHDLSFSGSPEEWAREAIRAYRAFDCSCIVAEANQGGEMVRQTLRSVDPTVPVKLVHASKSKQARAEPIVALYEQGRVHHLNPREKLRKLETQMLEWDPTTGMKSPDRIDALVWGVHYLLVEKRIRFAVPPMIVGEGRPNPWDMNRSLNVA
jgi:phage terminase large subunit-like protein